jgi:hypothetical protein
MEEPTVLPGVRTTESVPNRRTLGWVFVSEHGLRVGCTIECDVVIDRDFAFLLI